MKKLLFAIICGFLLFVGCNKDNFDINTFTKGNTDFIERNNNSTILELEFTKNDHNTKINFKEILGTGTYIEVDFGDGSYYAGSGSNIPTKIYKRGKFIVVINADRINLNLAENNCKNVVYSSEMPRRDYFKTIKLNSFTEYVYVNFSNTGLESIEIDENHPPIFLQAYFSYCFYRCIFLETIPENLFRNSPQIVNFHACFYDCTALKQIPENLFKYNTNTINFLSCFLGCTSLVNIPENLFKHNAKVTSFHACFYGCTSLVTISENLFKNNEKVSSFGFCFANCISLECIPKSLFSNNNIVGSFMEVFLNVNL